MRIWQLMQGAGNNRASYTLSSTVLRGDIHGTGTTITDAARTIPGTPTSTRTVLLVGAFMNVPDDDTWDISGITWNGVTMTVSTHGEVVIPYDATPTNSSYLLWSAWAVMPSGTSGDLVITLTAAANSGIDWYTAIAVDYGTIPGAVSFYTPDVTLDGSDALSVVVNAEESVVAMALWRDTLGTMSDVTWSGGTAGNTESATSGTAPYEIYIEKATFQEAGAFTLTATPNVATDGEGFLIVAGVNFF